MTPSSSQNSHLFNLHESELELLEEHSSSSVTAVIGRATTFSSAKEKINVHALQACLSDTQTLCTLTYDLTIWLTIWCSLHNHFHTKVPLQYKKRHELLSRPPSQEQMQMRKMRCQPCAWAADPCGLHKASYFPTNDTSTNQWLAWLHIQTTALSGLMRRLETVVYMKLSI